MAWRLANDNHLAFSNGMGGGWFGNATNWADNARALGYRVDTTPAVGAVAQWTGADLPSSGGLGHVSWVKQVNADGSVVVEEYNYDQRLAYDQRVTRAPRYIHLQDLGPAGPPDAPPPAREATVPAPIPFGSWSAFVQTQFNQILGRDPDGTEAAAWIDRLASGGVAPDTFTANLIDAGPLPTQLGPVVRLYSAYFRRVPDSDGIAYWVGRYRFGASLGEISSWFARSPEFIATYGALDEVGFVAQLYRNTMARDPDPGGLAYWVDELKSGRLTGGDVLVGFSESNEFRFRSGPSTEVTIIYEALLGRTPDPDGWAYWAAVLPTGPTTEALLIGTIRSSPEYRSRVGG